MKEGRVELAGPRRHCRTVKGAGHKLLSISDNLACVGAFEKGRSSSALLTLCRRACGYRLACEVQWRLRYLESDGIRRTPTLDGGRRRASVRRAG